MPRGYTIVRPDETSDDLEKEAARRLGVVRYRPCYRITLFAY